MVALVELLAHADQAVGGLLVPADEGVVGPCRPAPTSVAAARTATEKSPPILPVSLAAPRMRELGSPVPIRRE